MLPTAEYALFTLVMALATLGYSLAPTGIDQIVNRYQLEAGPRLLGVVLRPAALAALAFAAIGALVYELRASLILMLLVSTIAGGAMTVAGAQFQSERRFGLSLSLTLSPNLVLLVAAAAAVLLRWHEAWLPVFISTTGLVLAAAFGWGLLFLERSRKPSRETRFDWAEALSFAGLNAGALLLVQLERLIIPQVLPLHDLATYGVLAAIAGSLFRVLQMGVGYSLVPRLRVATDTLERRRLVAHEARLAGGIVLAGATTIWLVTPWIEGAFLAGKYHLSGALVLATIISGAARILNAFTRALTIALAESREVTVLNVLGWASVGVAILAGVCGGYWFGLVGVIYGVGLGRLLRAVTALYYAIRHLQPAASLAAPAP